MLRSWLRMIGRTHWPVSFTLCRAWANMSEDVVVDDTQLLWRSRVQVRRCVGEERCCISTVLRTPPLFYAQTQLPNVNNPPPKK